VAMQSSLRKTQCNSWYAVQKYVNAGQFNLHVCTARGLSKRTHDSQFNSNLVKRAFSCEVSGNNRSAVAAAWLFCSARIRPYMNLGSL